MSFDPWEISKPSVEEQLERADKELDARAKRISELQKQAVEWRNRYESLKAETEADNYHNDANFKDLERNYNELHEQVVVAIRLLQIVINDSSYSHTQKNGALQMICRWLDQPGAGGEIIDGIPF